MNNETRYCPDQAIVNVVFADFIIYRRVHGAYSGIKKPTFRLYLFYYSEHFTAGNWHDRAQSTQGLRDNAHSSHPLHLLPARSVFFIIHS
jgi:hypothetical protein